MEEEDVSVRLGITIPVDPSKKIESRASDTKMHSEEFSDSCQIYESLFDQLNFCCLPYSLDPNLGIMGQIQSSNLAYDVGTHNSWNIQPDFFDSLPQSNTSNFESSILIFGGFNPSSASKKIPIDFDHDDFVLGSTIFQYVLSSDIWKYYGTMIEPRCYHACTLDGQFVYVTGGYSLLQCEHGEMLAISTTDRLNLKGNQWKRCANMIMTRASHAVVSYKENLFAFGGRDSQGNILASVEKYNSNEDIWIEITYLPQPSMGLSATCVNDTIWLLGGITYDRSADPSKGFLSSVNSFTPSTKRWYNEEPLPYACAFSSCASDKNSLWLIGGCTPSYLKKDAIVSCSTVLQLNLFEKSSKWKSVSSLLYPRHAMTAVLLGEYIFVIAGMESENKHASNTVELINTITNTSTDIARTPVPIIGCTSVLILEDTATYMNKTLDKRTEIFSKVSVNEGDPCDLEKDKKYPHKTSSSIQKYTGNDRVNDIPIKSDSNSVSSEEKNFKISTENYFNPNRKNKESRTKQWLGIEDSIAHKNMDTKKTSFDVENSLALKSYKQNFTKQENINEVKSFNSYLETQTKKSQKYGNIKYRTSMEIFLNSSLTDDINACFLKKDKSAASKWLVFFNTLANSDEELHRVCQTKEPKLKMKTGISNSKSQKNYSTEVNYFEGNKIEVDQNPSDNLLSCTQNSASIPHQSFLYIQSNIETWKTKDSVVTDFEEAFNKTLISNRSNMEMDKFIDASSDEDKISINKESFPVVLLIGGEYPMKSRKSKYIHSYYCDKNSWETVGCMPEYRCHHSVVFFKNKIYVIGGFDSKCSRLNKNITRKSLCYDFFYETWHNIAEMNHARAFHSVFIFENEIYVLGGRNQLGKIISSIEVYNDSSNSWRDYKSVPYPLLGVAVLIFKGALYIFGGITYENDNEVISCKTTIFEFKNNSWSSGPDMPIRLAFCGAYNFSNSVWLFGGLKEDEQRIESAKDVFKLDADTEIWNKAAELSIPRHASVIVSLGTKVYVIGGYSTQDKIEVSVCEKIDILKNEVTIQEPLPMAISGRAGIMIDKIDESVIEAT